MGGGGGGAIGGLEGGDWVQHPSQTFASKQPRAAEMRVAVEHDKKESASQGIGKPVDRSQVRSHEAGGGSRGGGVGGGMAGGGGGGVQWAAGTEMGADGHERAPP